MHVVRRKPVRTDGRSMFKCMAQSAPLFVPLLLLLPLQLLFSAQSVAVAKTILAAVAARAHDTGATVYAWWKP